MISLPAVLTGLALAANPVWAPTGSLVTGDAYSSGRAGHQAVLLPSGRVLVVGGQGYYTPLRTAEVYDPATGLWTATGSLAIGRWYTTATLLATGKVLVAGGVGSVGSNSPTATSELYDPVAGTWSGTGSLASARDTHTATRLASGRVLAAGGYVGGSSSATAEIYDPSSGSWSPTGSLAAGRAYHTATLLNDGRVLVVGGTSNGRNIATAEIFDPATGRWTTTGTMRFARRGHTATLLADGQVVVMGGGDEIGYGPETAEVYSPFTGLWSTVNPMIQARSWHTATRLPSGMVLVAGGYRQWPVTDNRSGELLSTAELFDPIGAGFTQTDDTLVALGNQTATLLGSGQVLLAGGNTRTGGMGIGNTAELYDPSASPVQISSGPNRVVPGGAATFGASGGSGGYQWSIATNGSGATINATTGAYRAGTTAPRTDVVKVTDSAGSAMSIPVLVTTSTTPLAIAPALIKATPNSRVNYVATGGSGTGYVFKKVNSNSMGACSDSGWCSFGSTGGVTDVVRVTDSLGEVATAVALVTTAPVPLVAGYYLNGPDPATTMTGTAHTLVASGGASYSYRWSLIANGSGGTLTPEGAYVAGPNAGTDVAMVTDYLSQSATVTIHVISPSTLSLSVALAGTGSGTVTGAGISCSTGSTSGCTATPAQGSSVALTALPAAGSTFAGWSGGGCSGTGSCVVTMTSSLTVTATFQTQSSPPSTSTGAAAGGCQTGGGEGWIALVASAVLARRVGARGLRTGRRDP